MAKRYAVWGMDRTFGWKWVAELVSLVKHGKFRRQMFHRTEL